MSASQVQQYMMFLLGRREYTIRSLRDKAIEKGYSAQDISDTLQHLIHHKIVDDERFAEIVCHQYTGSKGSLWMRQKMTKLKFDRERIDSILENYDNTPSDDFIKKVTSKYSFDSADELDYPTKQKVANYIARQGFPNAITILNSI